MKSTDVMIITDSNDDFEPEWCIGISKLFARFEDWVRDLVMERALVKSKKKFKLLVRLKFENTIDDKTTIAVRGKERH